MHALDYAILYGNYQSAMLLLESTDLIPKMMEFYENNGKEKNIRYCNYKIFLEHLVLKVPLENVPNFTVKDIKGIIISFLYILENYLKSSNLQRSCHRP